MQQGSGDVTRPQRCAELPPTEGQVRTHERHRMEGMRRDIPRILQTT